jgi:hypothetical protein
LLQHRQAAAETLAAEAVEKVALLSLITAVDNDVVELGTSGFFIRQ